jgi:hypothetical protein
LRWSRAALAVSDALLLWVWQGPGAAVVVNDLGVLLAGEGEDLSAAQQVAGEIVAAGGRAVANGDSVASWNGGLLCGRQFCAADETYSALLV